MRLRSLNCFPRKVCDAATVVNFLRQCDIDANDNAELRSASEPPTLTIGSELRYGERETVRFLLIHFFSFFFAFKYVRTRRSVYTYHYLN